MRYLIIVLSLFLITCGGGGGGGSPTEPVGPTEPTAPTVEDILLTTNEDVPSVIDLKGTDPANLPLTFTISSPPNNGSFVLSGNAGTYTPNANYNGSDELQYIASNGSKSSNIGTVTITINPVNDDPESIDVSVSTNEDHSIDITLEANEYDGDEIVFQIDEQVSNGTLSLSGNVASYTPNTNWYGVDNFVFSVYDNTGKSVLKSGNGTIVVNPINDLPTVEDIYDIVVEYNELTPIPLNGSDVDGDALSFEIVNPPSKANVSVSNDTVYFSPTSGFGADTFTFKAYDGTAYSDEANTFIDISSSSHMTSWWYKQSNSYNGERISGIYHSSGFTIVGTSYPHVDGMYAIILWKIDSNLYVHKNVIFKTGDLEQHKLKFLNERVDGGLIMGISGLNDGLEHIVLLDADLNIESVSSEMDLRSGWENTFQVLPDGRYIYGGHVYDSSFNRLLFTDYGAVTYVNNHFYALGGQSEGSGLTINKYDTNLNLLLTIDSDDLINGLGHAMFPTEDGFFIIQAVQWNDPEGFIDLWKFDQDLNLIFKRVIGSSESYGTETGINITSDNGLYVMGRGSDEKDIEFFKLNKDGNEEFLFFQNNILEHLNSFKIIETDDVYQIFINYRAHLFVVQVTKLGNRIF